MAVTKAKQATASRTKTRRSTTVGIRGLKGTGVSVACIASCPERQGAAVIRDRSDQRGQRGHSVVTECNGSAGGRSVPHERTSAARKLAQRHDELSLQPDWIQPPYSVTDLIAALLWILAGLYAVLHVRDREPGAGWLAAAMALLALFIGYNERHLPTEPVWASGATYGWFTLAMGGIACLGVGLVGYVGLHGRARVL